MKKYIKIFISISILLVLILPVISFAETTIVSTNGGLVPCGTVATDNIKVHGVDYKKGEVIQCDINDALTLANNVIIFVFKDIAIPVAAIMFAYAGFLLITAGGEAASARTKAKSIFTNAVIGLVLAAAAWIIIISLINILGGYKGAVYW